MFFSKLKESFLDLIYPPYCFSCGGDIAPNEKILCHLCFRELEMISPKLRCPLCFSDRFTDKQKICHKCRDKISLLNGCAAAFDYDGSAISLVRHFKYANKPYLSKGLAAFMTLQYLRLGWPKPDYIIPVPISLTKWLTRGYNQSQMLAEEIASMLSSTCIQPLKKRLGGYSQAQLSKEERLQLALDNFTLKSDENLADKVLLIVDDVMTTGSTLQCCAERLLEGYPNKVYALSLCRATES